MDNEVQVSEFKVVTYIDLLTSVAGVPSFLLLIYRFVLKRFEKFHSDCIIYNAFVEKVKIEPNKDTK